MTNSGSWLMRSLPLWLMVCCNLFCNLSLVNAQVSDTETLKAIDVAVDKSLFEHICVQTALSDEQQQIATAMFESYYAKVRSLDDITYDAMLDAGLRRSMQLDRQSVESFNPLDTTSPDHTEQDALWMSWKAQYARGLQQSDVLLAEWLEDLQLLLSDSQRKAWFRIPLDVRRACFLRTPKQLGSV